MRVHQITCPKCGAGLKSKAGIPVGQTVPCPKCKTKFAVEAPDEPDVIDDADVVEEVEVVEDFEVDEPAPKKKGPPPVPAAMTRKPSARRVEDEDEDEDEDDRPRKKGPRAKVKRSRPPDDEEDEEFERPRRKKKRREDEEENLYLRLKHNVAVRVITLVVLLAILAVLAYLYYDLKIKPQNEPAGPSRPGNANEEARLNPALWPKIGRLA